MFNLKIEREKTDGEHVIETYEGVVDVKNPPFTDIVLIEKNDGSKIKATLGHIINVNSPLK